MQIKLTNEELSSLYRHQNFIKKLLKRRIPFQFFMIILSIALGLYFQNLPLIIAGVIVVLISLYINYQISFKWIQELKKDIEYGFKFVEILEIKKIKKGRIYIEVIMNNGLKINEIEFESFDIPTSDLKTNKTFSIEFSPKNGYIFNIIPTEKKRKERKSRKG